MFVTSDKQRSGLLVAIITGGRPKISQRPTANLLQNIEAAGVAKVIWVVSEKDAPAYEQDGRELSIYPMEWAEEYAATHWMQPTPYEPGSFFGAFVGREWACLEAERRGHWGVLQLDDNIEGVTLGFGRGAAASKTTEKHGSTTTFVDLLTAIALSTNGHMVGATLTATPEAKLAMSRKGFPYSFFIEKVGPDREHWYGPFEDDITHALQYGTRAENSTAIICPLLGYWKESKSKTGMRAQYNHTRAVQLQRIFPEAAQLSIMATKANGIRGTDTARVFHKLQRGAIKNPQIITNRELYNAAKGRMVEILHDYAQEFEERNREKMRARSAPYLK